MRSLIGGLAGAAALLAVWQLRRPAPAAPPPTRELLDLAEMCAVLSKEDRTVGTNRLELLEQRVRALESEGPPEGEEAFKVRTRLADLLLRHGRNRESVALYQDLLAESEEAGDEEAAQRTRRALGIAHMRSGEAINCVEHAAAERCLFPIQGGGVWPQPDHAVRAQRLFEAYLERQPDADDVRWLLNIVHMTAGTYPDGVPDAWLLPPELFASESALPPFPNVAAKLGIDTLSGAGGGIMDDFDGDGRLDVVVSSIQPCDPMRYYHNAGDGAFEDWTERAGLLQQVGGLNCMHADYDNDGRLDLLVLRGGWQGVRLGRQRNSLLRQEESGAFRDVTFETGLASPAYPTQAAGWADYDGDGDLDLFVGNEMFPAQLFRNDGGRSFQDVAAEAGVAGNREYVKGVAWGDYDNDGDPDLYVSSFDTANLLYRNEGDGTFVEVAVEAGVAVGSAKRRRQESAPTDSDVSELMNQLVGAERTFATWFWDVDNDGWLDLFVGGFDANLEHVARDYAGRPAERERLRVYMNDGTGHFVDAADRMGVADVRLPMGANFGDVDNDGYLDFYLGTGRPAFEFLVPNTLYRNVGGTRFEEATSAARVGHLQKGHGIAFGDLDNDGDQDLLAQMGGFYPADAFPDALFENPGNANAWITVLTRGVRSNRFGLDARLRVIVRTPTGERTICKRVTSGGSFGGSSFQQEIGLGDATEIVRLEVDWPTSGERQVFEGPPLRAFVQVTEGEAEYVVLERSAIRLGG